MLVWGCSMIEWILVACLLACGIVLAIVLSRREPAMRIVLPGDPMSQPDHSKFLPWHTPSVPIDATHIAWIMHGAGEGGNVHTLYLQSLDSLRDEIVEARSPWGPVILHSIELETDIRSRGCVPISEVLYAIARVDPEGNEQWLSRSGSWVNRWAREAQIYEVFPGQVR